MRPVEILLVAALALSLLPALLPVGERGARLLKGARWLAPLLLLLHLATEGGRWQMVPAYLTAILLPLWALWQRGQGAPRRASRLVNGLGVAALVTSTALALLLPVPLLPAPTGPYEVGTVTYYLVDEARAEPYRPDLTPKRELMVQVWYPAAPAPGSKAAPWLRDAPLFTPALARFLGLPSFALSHLGLVRSHAFEGAPLATAEERYPVLLYSHGWTGFRAVSSTQMETLASHGYVAVAADHTYGALVTVFPGGRVALNHPAALPDGVPDEEYDRASRLLVRTYADDVRFILDRLAGLDAGEEDGRFANRLDLERVGLFGHSTGGGAIVLACSEEPRCRAGLGMDAWVEPVPDAQIEGGLTQPFLFMRSEPWTRNDNDARLARLYDASTGPRYRLGIQGTVHRDFTLQSQLSPLTSLLGLSGSLDGRRALVIIDDYLVAFFDTYLKGEAAPLLAPSTSPYPEVQFERTP